MGELMKRRLMFHGTLLFLLGLLTGLLLAVAGPQLANPRGVLAGHLEAVMNGTFLLAIAFVSQEVRLSERAGKIMLALLLYGTYVNWIATTAAGLLGTSEATPIAGAGHHAGSLAEKLVLVVLTTVALAMIAGVSMLLAGLRARPSID